MISASLLRPFVVASFAFAAVFLNTSAKPKGEPSGKPETYRIMSFNMWHDGWAGKQPFEQSIAVVKESGADIVGLQECSGETAGKLAEALGWHSFDQGGRTAIISRFKIIGHTPGKWGVKLELPSGRHVYAFNAHLAHCPYQPYQLVGIPYGNAPMLSTAEEAVAAAEKARSGQVSRLLAEVKEISSEGAPMSITGDFNEPSCLDWTPAAVKEKFCPMEVKWPSTATIIEAGFTDAYRSVFPDPVKHRGLTWTMLTKLDNPKDKHDRIDFVFVKGVRKITDTKIVGESKEFADIVVSPYPSDHRTVVAEVEY